MTRWLNASCDKEYSNKQVWSALVELLEKELKVQQRKIVLQSNDQESYKQQNENQKRKESSLYGNQKSYSNRCHNCGNDGHITSIGPKGT